MCAPNPNSCGGYGGCQGSTAELAFDYLANNEIGIFEEYQYSYSSYYGQDYACAVPNINAPATIGGFVKLPGYLCTYCYYRSSGTQTMWLFLHQ